MNHRQCPRFAFRLLGLFTVILALGAAASAEWKEKVLYSFQGGTDGATPAGSVVFDQHGNLYGATTDGGSDDCPGIAQCGTVFQLQPPDKKGAPWTENLLYIFKGKNSNDGETPAGGVIFDQAGNLYGTTAYGGSGDCVLLGTTVGCGVVFQMRPPQNKGGAWTETVLHSFQGGKDGYVPQGNLTLDSAGNLYGATLYGGGYGSCNSPYYQYCGTIFELTPPKTKGGKWKEKVLYSFKSGTDGANPNGGLVLDSNGAVYGTTYAGGNQNCKYDASVGCGTAFELKSPSKRGGDWKEKHLHIFRGGNDGGQPNSLTFDAKGALYGTAGGGNPSGGGIVFRLAVSAGGRWKETVLHWFSNNGPGASLAGLSFDSVGNLFGTTIAGTNYSGTVFRLKPPESRGSSWTLSILYNFKGTPDGHYPAATLTFDAGGNLYGTTEGGGSSDNGIVFKAEP
jgi:uncharacterized repeat protein (TIGR03803 family)